MIHIFPILCCQSKFHSGQLSYLNIACSCEGIVITRIDVKQTRSFRAFQSVLGVYRPAFFWNTQPFFLFKPCLCLLLIHFLILKSPVHFRQIDVPFRQADLSLSLSASVSVSLSLCLSVSLSLCLSVSLFLCLSVSLSLSLSVDPICLIHILIYYIYIIIYILLLHNYMYIYIYT